MRKTILTTVLVLVSILSFSQMTLIETDTLNQGNLITQSNYQFYYSDKFMMFGKEEESEDNYTMFKFQDSKQKSIGGCIYEIHKTDSSVYLYLSKECGTVMISEEDKTFIFY